MILQKVVEDPQSGSCPNISYADYTGPVASANPTGSPFANTAFTQNRTQEMVVSSNQYPQQGAAAYGIGINGNMLSNSLGSGISNLNLNAALAGTQTGSMSTGALENLKMTLRSSGYSDHATEEISMAMNTLASYGILGMIGLNQMPGTQTISMAGGANAQQQIMSMNTTMGANMMAVTPTSQQQNPNNASYLNNSANSATGSLFGPVGSGTSGLGSSGSTGAGSSLFGSSSPSIGQERYGGSPMLNDSFTVAGATAYSTPAGYPAQAVDRPPNISINQNSFGIGTGMMSPTDDKGQSAPLKQEQEVSESIVGAILGPGGKGIVELQKYTQTNIQISKKGVYVPGTRNRIVTITGTPSNIQKATYLIQQRIAQEECKRQSQVRL